jgi:hypothetical protein
VLHDVGGGLVNGNLELDNLFAIQPRARASAADLVHERPNARQFRRTARCFHLGKCHGVRTSRKRDVLYLVLTVNASVPCRTRKQQNHIALPA